MIIKEDKNYISIFGSKFYSVNPEDVRGVLSEQAILQYPFTVFSEQAEADALACLHQVHGVNGKVVKCSAALQQFPLFVSDGDFLITHLPKTMLGIVTADCLPIMVSNPKKNVIGAAHAGWRGSVAGVGVAMVEALCKTYQSEYKDMLVQFGPSAKVCCYQVDQLFVDQLAGVRFAQEALAERDGSLYFDLPLFNKLSLIHVGVLPQNIDMSSNVCTICNPSYCSFRRDKDLLRQLSIISLKE